MPSRTATSLLYFYSLIIILVTLTLGCNGPRDLGDAHALGARSFYIWKVAAPTVSAQLDRGRRLDPWHVIGWQAASDSRWST